jgi:hypothetical protein
MDMSVDLIGATVELEQPLGSGLRTVGTGFRVVLITANHVFEKMKGDKATVGFRVQTADGSWSYAPQKIAIRQGGQELWTHHAVRDVAAIRIVAPPAFAKAAIPLAWLAGDDAMTRYALSPGDEMMTLGFPQGLSANTAGFPILRAGKVASYPLGPSTAFPTFLLDFHVFPGNSGGPVFLEPHMTTQPGAEKPPTHLIAGLLTQEVEVGAENLGIGIVTQARFVRETLAMLDAPVPTAASKTSGLVGTPVAAVAKAQAISDVANAADH